PSALPEKRMTTPSAAGRPHATHAAAASSGAASRRTAIGARASRGMVLPWDEGVGMAVTDATRWSAPSRVHGCLERMRLGERGRHTPSVTDPGPAREMAGIDADGGFGCARLPATEDSQPATPRMRIGAGFPATRRPAGRLDGL